MSYWLLTVSFPEPHSNPTSGQAQSSFGRLWLLLKSKLTEDQDVGTQTLVSRWQSSPAEFYSSSVLGELWKLQLKIRLNPGKSWEEEV